MKKLVDIFEMPQKGRAHKWPHYFEIYERWFSEFREKKITLLEIGICGGGSLWMWKEYFPQAKIIGIDIDPKTKKYEGKDIEIFIGDQADKEFLNTLAENSGPFDIIIDDGGHKMDQIIVSCETLFPHLTLGGIYFIEDLHSSYWESHDGSYRGQGTAIEFLKGLVDCINWRRHEEDQENYFNKNLASIHFYESVALLQKVMTHENYVKPAIKSKKRRFFFNK